MSSFFEKWYGQCDGVARKVAPALKRYGWEADDASQHVAAKLLAVGENHRFRGMTDECLSRILPRFVRRVLFRAVAPKKCLVSPATEQVLALAESRGDAAAAELLTDILADAPAQVRSYIEAQLTGTFAGGRTRESTAANNWLSKRLEVV